MADMSDWTRAGNAAAARRGELELTQAQLAARAGVDAKTIYNLEVAGRKPIARNRTRIETALDWPPGQLERIASDSPVIVPPRMAATTDEAIDLLEQGLAELRRLREEGRGKGRDDDKTNGGSRRAG